MLAWRSRAGGDAGERHGPFGDGGGAAAVNRTVVLLSCWSYTPAVTGFFDHGEGWAANELPILTTPFTYYRVTQIT